MELTASTLPSQRKSVSQKVIMIIAFGGMQSNFHLVALWVLICMCECMCTCEEEWKNERSVIEIKKEKEKEGIVNYLLFLSSQWFFLLNTTAHSTFFTLFLMQIKLLIMNLSAAAAIFP